MCINSVWYLIRSYVATITSRRAVMFSWYIENTYLQRTTSFAYYFSLLISLTRLIPIIPEPALSMSAHPNSDVVEIYKLIPQPEFHTGTCILFKQTSKVSIERSVGGEQKKQMVTKWKIPWKIPSWIISIHIRNVRKMIYNSASSILIDHLW